MTQSGHDKLIIELVSALEATGVPRESYQLYDHVDPEALSRLVDSLNGEYRICFRLADVQVTVTHHGVETTSRVSTEE